MKAQQQYVGLDVSLDGTSVCVVDEAGAILWRGKCHSTPDSIDATLAKHAPDAVRVGIETGQLSTWLFHQLKARRHPILCIDARHAKAALSLQINKTDANDAHGIAQIVRVGWYREVLVKRMDSHAVRAVLTARAQLVTQKITLTNSIRGLLKTFGIVLGRGKGARFDAMVRGRVAEEPMLVTIVEPVLAVLLTVRGQLAVFERLLRRRARADADARLLMTAPGVGAVVALAYATTIEDPGRFRRSSSVAAYVGLTPRRYQSGEMDRAGHISRCGDAMLRTYLYEAANVLLRRSTRPSPLSVWGRALAERVGGRKALVAIARKLAVVLYSMWRDRTEFRFASPAARPWAHARSQSAADPADRCPCRDERRRPRRFSCSPPRWTAFGTWRRRTPDAMLRPISIHGPRRERWIRQSTMVPSIEPGATTRIKP